ncbi:MAG: OmpA family protein [bacterium]|nr:OmpA family protein [bacterium]
MQASFQGGRGLAAVVLASLLASCVSQQQYDEAVSLAKRYQTDLHDLEAQMASLEGENTRLASEMRTGDISQLQNANFSTIQERMSDLQKQLMELNRPLKDVERFDVEGGYIFMIQDKLLFESGQAELGEEGRTALLELVSEISAAPHGRIMVRGHTDSDPVKKPETLKRFPRGNLELSAARAVAVGHLLTTEGKIPANDVVVMGFGRWEELLPNDSAANKRLNRRVEIFVADE